MLLQETTYYLEMRCRDDHQAAATPDNPPHLRRVDPPQPALNAELYASVGRDWLWVDRSAWCADRWLAQLTQPGFETWIASRNGTITGYFELWAREEGDVKLDYFGIMPEFVGQGLGGWMLSQAVQQAWDRDPAPHRVWLHTSSYDSPAALKNYQARGFRLYDQVVAEREYPDDAVARWQTRNPGRNVVQAPAQG